MRKHHKLIRYLEGIAALAAIAVAAFEIRKHLRAPPGDGK